MAYCHECGDEVADIDSFCPHCGISLQPIAMENEPDLESTIAISREEIAQTLSEPKPAEQPKPAAPAENLMPRLGQDDRAAEEAEQPAQPVGSIPEELPLGEPAASVQEDEEIPEPVLLSTEPEIRNVQEESITVQDDESEPEPSADLSEETLPEFETEPNSQILPENDQSDYFADSETGDLEDPEISLADAALDDFVPAAVDTGEIPRVEPQSTVEERTETADPSGTGAQMQADTVEEPLSEMPVEEELSIDESGLVQESSSEISDQETIEGEPDADLLDQFPSEPAILKPSFEPAPEEESAVSQFDSVSIMESGDDRSDESFEELKEEDHELVEALPEPADVPAADATDREARSFTSPNMNGPDTDGKKSKLKPLDEGTILNNRYEIVRKIGGGGMGAVYLASDKNLGGVLRAVKEMVQSYIEETQQEKAVNDFKRESMLLTSLEHSAIPTIYDYFYDEKEARFYLVMKYINGGDLSSRLRSAPEGRIDERTVVEWAIQVADVLDYLHKRQPPIVYRDLKPANIMIDGNSDRVMLIDFGIARWINKEEKGVTAVGTMGYAPPELFSGNVEPRSDIYSLGSTMFHLLTGADPQSNPLLIFDFQKNPRPRQINPQLSDQIEEILMTAVEYNADKRFKSTADMRRALEEHLENLKANRVTFGLKESPKSVTLSDEKVFCGFCGQSIVASDLFCAFCGAKQPIAQKGVHSESYSSVPVTARLTIIGTNELESPSYTIDKDENLVGRRDPMSNIFPEIDLSKFDPQTKISRRHARIWRDGNKFMVEDLGSSNGTILLPVVSDALRLVPNQPHLLANGDRLKLGDTMLHFVIG